MTLESLAPLDAIKARWTAAGAQRVSEGAPESQAVRKSVYITGGRFELFDTVTGLLERRGRFFNGVYWRVGGAEATAERESLALIDAFIIAFHTGADAGRTLGGTVETAALESVAIDEPLYQVVAGVEYRVHPLIIVYTQYLIIGG
jgi:hypothetical protein